MLKDGGGDGAGDETHGGFLLGRRNDVGEGDARSTHARSASSVMRACALASP